MELSSEEFWKTFEALPTPLQEDQTELVFAAGVEVGGYRIARNVRDQPCLLIESEARGSLVAPRLRHLRVLPEVSCELINVEGGREQRQLTVIEPVDVDEDLARIVVSLYHTLAVEAGPRPSTSSVQVLLGEVAELFRRFGAQPRTTAQGLWAELFVIVQASDPLMAARAWHEDFTERWDFVDGPLRVEVKSSGATGDRRHHFTQDQVCPPDDTNVWVLSLWVIKSAAGMSIGDLLAELRERFRGAPEVLARVEQIAISAIGRDATDMLDEAFDPEVATSSALFVPAQNIAKPGCVTPAGVSRVSFVSDLEFARASRPIDLAKRNDLLGCIAKGLTFESRMD